MGLVGNGFYGNLPYHATKGAVVNMTRALASEWASRGVRVNAIAPTFTKTDLTKQLLEKPEMVARIEDRTPMGRLAEPEEMAGAILYLASPASSMVTGHTLPVDGGWLAI
jgi:NAD(P)-dependent dehydrogenase (short-subunit alcohol dehydrogenase family)